MSKCGVFPGPYFPVFGLNTEKYVPEKTPYLDIFHTVNSGKIFKKNEALLCIENNDNYKNVLIKKSNIWMWRYAASN